MSDADRLEPASRLAWARLFRLLALTGAMVFVVSLPASLDVLLAFARQLVH